MNNNLIKLAILVSFAASGKNYELRLKWHTNYKTDCKYHHLQKNQGIPTSQKKHGHASTELKISCD